MANATNAPINSDHAWFAGEDQALRWTIYDSVGAAQDITGWTISFKMAATQSGASVLTKTSAITTAASGITTVSVAAADTSTLGGTYFYTLSRTDSGSNQVLAYGLAVLQARPS